MQGTGVCMLGEAYLRRLGLLWHTCTHVAQLEQDHLHMLLCIAKLSRDRAVLYVGIAVGLLHVHVLYMHV